MWRLPEHNRLMWRHILTVVVAAALGSLTAALIWTIWEGGGAWPENRHLLLFWLTPMFFTLPGALMLLGLRAMLLDHGVAGRTSNLLVLAAGGGAGFLVLTLISGADTEWGATGALFGAITALMLLLIQGLWAERDHPKRPLRLGAVFGGLCLLALVTLIMLPI